MLWDKDLVEGSSVYNFIIDDSKVIRVIAGPGAGKSFALQRRIMRLIEKDNVSPEKILVITYSKVAAEYLKDDIRKIDIEGSDDIIATTLHDLCFRLLTKNQFIAPTRHMRTMQQFEQRAMLYDLSDEYGTLHKRKERIRMLEAELETGDNSDESFSNDVLVWLKNHNAILFGEIITLTAKYLEENPSCSELDMYDYVLVDEYQDLNRAEQKVVDLLSAKGCLVVIGDDDQSIYGFKHAHPEGIRLFKEEHKDCTDHVLKECRRCPKIVVDMASRLIANNEDRVEKEFVPYNDNQIGEVEVITSETHQDEIQIIAEMIKAEIENGVNLDDFLVLTTTRNIAENLREELYRVDIPAKSFFKENVLKTEQLKKAFSLLSLLANPSDLVSWRYLLGHGGDKFRAKSYKRVLEYATESDTTVLEVLEKCVKNVVKIPYTSSLIKVYVDLVRELTKLKAMIANIPVNLIDILTEDVPDNYEFRELLSIALDKSEYSKEMDLEFWVNSIYTTMLKSISLPENIIDGKFIKIMSLHSSKGLSAKCLIILHATQGLLPREPFGLKKHYNKHVEEKRRLFYVAVTRCKGNQPDYPGKLIISTIEGRESQFIEELLP